MINAWFPSRHVLSASLAATNDIVFKVVFKIIFRKYRGTDDGEIYVITYDCFRTLGQYVLVVSEMTDNFRIKLNTFILSVDILDAGGPAND